MHRPKRFNHFVQYDKRYNRKILFVNGYHLNGNPSECHARTQKLQTMNHVVQHNKQHNWKILLNRFHLNEKIHLQIQKLEPPCTALHTALQESTAQ